MPLEWLSREVWAAAPARRVVSITPPARHVFLTMPASSRCTTNEDCSREMRILQDRHMRKQGMNDIRYNYAIGGNGQFLEGRGWITRTVLNPEHKDIENSSLIIAFLGGYTQQTLPKLMYDFGVELVECGVRNLFIDKEFKMHDLYEVEDNVYNEL